MTTSHLRPLEASLADLFQHLGINRAHFAAGQLVPTDWVGLVARYPERVASLTLVSPRPGRPELEALGPRLMVLAGDAGPSAEGPAKLLGQLKQARSLVLRDYEYLPWSDLAADRASEIAPAWLHFLDELPVPALAIPEGKGEAAGISYRIRGSGPPLVLMPLDLAPSQWEPLIAELAARYLTVTLGGPLVGVVALLEGRGRTVPLCQLLRRQKGPHLLLKTGSADRFDCRDSGDMLWEEAQIDEPSGAEAAVETGVGAAGR